MIPLRHEKYYQQTAPIIVYLLIALNIAVFIIEIIKGEQFIAGYCATPYEITHGIDLIKSVDVPGIGSIPQTPGPTPIYITLLTSMFMHASLMHIAGNMLYLWVFGDLIENNFGHFKFLIFYLIAGLAASFAQIATDPNSLIPSLGASGAIAGVLGAYMVMYPNSRIRVLLLLGFYWTITELPALVVIGFWIIIQFLNEFGTIIDNSMSSNVAYMAHIGGFMIGAILALFLRSEKE